MKRTNSIQRLQLKINGKHFIAARPYINLLQWERDRNRCGKSNCT